MTIPTPSITTAEPSVDAELIAAAIRQAADTIAAAIREATAPAEPEGDWAY